MNKITMREDALSRSKRREASLRAALKACVHALHGCFHTLSGEGASELKCKGPFCPRCGKVGKHVPDCEVGRALEMARRLGVE